MNTSLIHLQLVQAPLFCVPCVHTDAVVPTLVVAGAALGASPVHRAQPPAVGGLVADPAPQERHKTIGHQ